MCMSFPHSSVGKESACNAGDPGLIPGLGRSAGEEIEYPLQYSWASLVAQLVKNPPAMWKTWVRTLSWEDPWGRERLSIPVFCSGEFHELCSSWGHKESARLTNFHFDYILLSYEDFICFVLSLPFSSIHPSTILISKLHSVLLLCECVCVCSVMSDSLLCSSLL